jgi:hypothetical protein
MSFANSKKTFFLITKAPVKRRVCGICSLITAVFLLAGIFLPGLQLHVKSPGTASNANFAVLYGLQQERLDNNWFLSMDTLSDDQIVQNLTQLRDASEIASDTLTFCIKASNDASITILDWVTQYQRHLLPNSQRLVMILLLLALSILGSAGLGLYTVGFAGFAAPVVYLVCILLLRSDVSNVLTAFREIEGAPTLTCGISPLYILLLVLAVLAQIVGAVFYLLFLLQPSSAHIKAPVKSPARPTAAPKESRQPAAPANADFMPISINMAATVSSVPGHPFEEVHLASASLVRLSTGTVFNISNPSTVILGRSTEHADFPIDNAFVARTHAKITCQNGVCSIEDLASSNGTFVDGQQLYAGERVTLQNGSIITLANESFRFQQ